jgi:hypothetical protein
LEMNEMVQMLVGAVAKLLLIASGAFYTILVLTTYAKQGPDYQLHFESGHPARSAERFLIWMGIKVAAAMAFAFKWILELLFEASADVGVWAVSKSTPQVQARVISRFR